MDESKKDLTPAAPLHKILPQFAGEFNGNSYVKDPETGYLVTRGDSTFKGFTRDKKLLAVKLFESHPNNIGKVCKAVGITRQTFSNHYAFDAKFRHDIDEIRENHLDDIEETFMQNGKSEKGFMHGIASLRAYRQERWNPETKVTINHESTLSPVERAKKIDAIQDAEIADGQRDELEGRG